MQRGEAAHRQSDDVRALDAGRIHHRRDIRHRERLRIRVDIFRYVGRRITARRERDAAVPARERAQLWLPAFVAAAELVYEHDRRSLAGLFVVEAYAALTLRVAHRITSFF